MRHKILNYSLAITGALAVELILAIAMIMIFDSPVEISYAKPVSLAVIKSPEINSTNAILNVTYPKQEISGLPIRLKIPKIKVDAAFESVGLTAQSAIGVPKNPVNAAWYNLGPRPGEAGNAVITGHYGPWKNGAKSVFNNLNKLRAGDKIYVEDDKGIVTAFIVRGMRSFGEKDDASSIFTANDSGSHLILITCEGVWNSKTKSYSKRLVIFADKE